MTTATAIYPTLENRPLKDTIVLFDVDETLSKARRVSCDNAFFNRAIANTVFLLSSLPPLRCTSYSLGCDTSAPLDMSVLPSRPLLYTPCV